MRKSSGNYVWWTWAILMVLFIVSLLIALKVFATDCSYSNSPEQELQVSTAVFSGKALSIENGTPSNSVFFEAEKVWKGEVGKYVLVKTAAPPATWGYGFETGKKYLVYATGKEENLEVNLCSRTKLLSEAGEDIGKLGTKTIPLDSKKQPSNVMCLPDPPKPGDKVVCKSYWNVWGNLSMATIAAIIIVGIVSLFIARRKNKFI